jgi:hypothetical protein
MLVVPQRSRLRGIKGYHNPSSLTRPPSTPANSSLWFTLSKRYPLLSTSPPFTHPILRHADLVVVAIVEILCSQDARSKNPSAFFSVQIQTVSDLPPLKAVLEPLLPVGGAQPLQTDDIPDGQRIPLLKELLREVRICGLAQILDLHSKEEFTGRARVEMNARTSAGSNRG